MSRTWVIVLIIASLAGRAIMGVMRRMIEEEAETRLTRIPFVLIALAVARLPGELRDDLAAEWRAELDSIVHETEGMPLTRLWRGIRYAGSLLMSAPAVADGLRGTSRRLLRAARLVGAAGAVYYAVWASILSYVWLGWYGKYTHGWIALFPEVTAKQAIMLTGSCAFGAAAFLCLAIWLVTAWRPLLYMGGPAWLAAEVFYYLGTGGVLYLWVAGGAFCLVCLIARQHLRRRLAQDRGAAPLPE